MPIDQYSLSAIPLEMWFRESRLASGTGFVWSFNQRAFLITNWHIVTGIHPTTGQHLSRTGAEPDAIVAQFDLAGTPGKRGPFRLPLHSASSEPLWLEHPSGRSVDVVALPLPEMPDYTLHPINEMPWEPMRLSVGLDAFILGYPFGMSVSELPIWKRASIASEPLILPTDGKPYFYVDTASREGMSGSPVILRSWGGFNTEDGDYTQSIGGSWATRIR